MAYKLEYPYTETERLDFIIEYEHHKHLKLVLVDNYIEEEQITTEEVVEEVKDENGYVLETYLNVPKTTTSIEMVNYPTYYALEPYEIFVNGEVIDNTEAWEAEQAQLEHERIQELYMTRSDFFDGTIDAWGIGEDELLFVVQRMLMGLPLDNASKLKAVNNFKNALNFYRKHTLFALLVNAPIQLTENVQVVITDEHLDNFFNEVANGNKDTAWQYLPQPVEIPVPIPDTEV